MLKVAFNAYLLAHAEVRGWTRYTVNLLAALPAHGVRPFLYSKAPIAPNHLDRLPAGSFEVRIASPMRYLMWEQRWLPRQCRADRIDVFHSPMNYGLPWSTPCPRVLTLHDAIDQIAARGQRTGWWKRTDIRSRLAHWISRRRAHHVITVSQHSRDDLIRVLGLPPSRVSVIPEAADPVFLTPLSRSAIEDMRSRWKLSKPYVFYVGGWEERKNISFLLKAFATAQLSGIDLVLAGGRDVQREELAEQAREAGMADRLRLLGYVPDSDLPALYAAALVFVYPSRYEGFGLQLVEAMAVGCPVLAARATSLPEVLGTGGETFRLDDVTELAWLLNRISNDPAFRAEMVDRSQRRAIDFSWESTAKVTRNLYHRLVLGNKFVTRRVEVPPWPDYIQ